ncbi:lumenal Hsp70 protein, partial [Ascosphaera acerosa]
MYAPGRRRKSPSSGSSFGPAIAIILALLHLFPGLVGAISASGVIGLDVGTEYVKAVLVQPGIPLEIVLTKDSKRKETAALALRPSRDKSAVFPERFYGGDAVALAARFPDDVYPNLKTLLGVPFRNGSQGPDAVEGSLLDLYNGRYPSLEAREVAGRGTVGFVSEKVGGQDGQDPFMVEELLAMQLKQIKANAESMGGAGAEITDAVITYPAFYTAEEKRSLQLAAELAGLNVLTLTSDGLAVGLNYATSRSFPCVTDGEQPEHHLVFDVGAGSTTASVLRFQSRKVKDVGRFSKTVQEVHVVGTGWDKTLGGDALNAAIVDDIVARFVASDSAPAGVSEADVRAHGRTMARLWREAERLRHILSANTETSAAFETLAGHDINFRYHLSRAAFEQLAQARGYVARVAQPVRDALAAAGLAPADLGSIILHGGASRTPFIQAALESACGDGGDGGGGALLRTNVNADEAAVFGAAFKGAELSPAFRVKEIRTYDAPSFAHGVRWWPQPGGPARTQKLFTPASRIGSEKQVTLKQLDDFELAFFQQYQRGGQIVEQEIDTVATTNLTQSVAALQTRFGCNASDIATKVTVRLRPSDGLPEVVGLTVSCDVVEEKKNVIDGVKDFFGRLAKKLDETTDPEPAEEPITVDETTADTVMPTSSPATATAASTAASPSPSVAADSPVEADAQTKTRTEVIPISFTATQLRPPPLAAAELARIQARLQAFD